jgi:hypothetical protein
MMVAGDCGDMELDDREIETEHLVVDGEPYAVVEDEQGQVVIEGYTMKCHR